MLTKLMALVLAFLFLGGSIGMTSDLSIPTTAPNGALEQIPATVSKPDGPGPFPAVVIMHDCSGLGPTSSGAPDRWARELVERGYVVRPPRQLHNAWPRQWRVHRPLSQPYRSEPLSPRPRCVRGTRLSADIALRRWPAGGSHGRLARRDNDAGRDGCTRK